MVQREALLLIGNADVAASGGATFERTGPLGGEPTVAAAASAADAIAAADAAAAALPAWAALGPNERRRLLLAGADALEAQTGAFVEAMAAETGASNGWAGFNVHLAAGLLREAAALTTQVKGETILSDRPGCYAMTLRRPAGVVLGIAPWNAPVILGVRAIATPLACGNTVVLKASEHCPATHRLIGTALRSAGFPAGVVNVVTNAPADAGEVVAALVNHRAVRRINFTGSTRVGRIIAGLAAQQLKPCLLELGGKAPMIVLDDADLDAAVAAAGFGAYMNSGQICMSTERIILEDGIADAFVERFRARVDGLTAGDPRAGSAPLGSVVDEATGRRVRHLIEDAVGKGARAHGDWQTGGTLIPAIVVDGVTPDMLLYSEESFGPVTTILRAANEDVAVRIANDTEYGLTSSVFSQNIARALRVAERIEAGMCHINGATVHDEAQMPFGGTKASGYGRFGGEAGIAEFTELKWVTIDTQTPHWPI
ncbi:aldehyde dehydrogenase (plasmid) [Novosphingobium aromaticivorans DSM 12444]|uniref:Aldehyde dehydrogenase n=1 Tax=Novosphingobium aromaticivorans (strain ATCC 700278 / DSM 12444 / CCUG 56034 / CIP 105152 / NBRC 16084 / F199) TaxID=279238 RepID=A4XEI0_NOVAD|nr:aldehyde dehydrogenase [Novosphingobium aromaticivorans]ABP64341.1 aldehyde dehydrogenase [Novosphingobium aromaticivorans DSM 12444]SCY81822.1 Acyl-CoA reductase [Novosphingobium aromaticivorans]